MMGFIFRQALWDFVRPRRVVVWILVALSLFGIAKVFQSVANGPTPTDQYSLMSSIITFRLVALAAAIFAMGVVAQEVEQKTIVYLLTRPIPRWMLLSMRTLAASIVVLAISWLAAIFVSLGTTGSFTNPLLGRDLIALAVGAFAYTSLFVFVSLLLNRAMIVCLLFAFGWETLIPNMPGDLYWLSIGSYLTAIAQRPAVKAPGNFLEALSGMLGTNTITADTAWLILACLIAATVVGGAIWFRENEYIPREDAE